MSLIQFIKNEFPLDTYIHIEDSNGDFCTIFYGTVKEFLTKLAIFKGFCYVEHLYLGNGIYRITAR